MNLIKMEPDADSETYLSYSHNVSEMLDIKEEGDPVSITFPLMKTENEVSFCVHPSAWTLVLVLVHGLLV
jgi:hypothetical protein